MAVALILLMCFLRVSYSENIIDTSRAFPVTTLINAQWAQTPLYLEVAEYLSDENPNLYWSFIKRATELDDPLNQYDNEQMRYNVAINIASSIISTLQLPVLKLVVALHSVTPRIQAHLQIAQEILREGNCVSTTFAQIGTEIACSLSELEAKLLQVDTTSLDASVETYSFDHIFPGTENNTRTVIVYGDIGSKEFARYHQYIINAKSLLSHVKYITRHFIGSIARRKVRLSGYGVELHLKSTEYKSQDDTTKQSDDNKENDINEEMEVQGFNFHILKEKYQELSHSLDRFRYALQKKNEEIDQLKAWEFQDLGLQATSSISDIQTEEALHILQLISQNFPMQAKSLLSQKVSDALRNEVKHNIECFGRSLNIVPPDGALFINGLFFDSESLDLNALIESLRSELRLLENLYDNNIKDEMAAGLLALDLSSSAKDIAIDIRSSAVTWINDIERDHHYQHWPSSAMDLLRPTFPGMLMHVRKNIFNLILVIDPLDSNQRNLIKLVESFIVHMAPIRLGLVFDVGQLNDDNAHDYMSIFCAFKYIIKMEPARAALSFLTDIFMHVNNDEAIRSIHVRNQLRKTYGNLSTKKIDEILSDHKAFDDDHKLSKEFIEQLGFKSSPQAVTNGVPLPQHVFQSSSDFEEAVFTEIMQQTAVLQKSVYRGDLTDSDEVIDYLMNQPHVMPRLNQRIIGNDNKLMDFTGVAHKDLQNVRALSQLSNADMTATLLENIEYFESGKKTTEKYGNNRIHYLTLWVIADLNNDHGRQLLMNALNYMNNAKSVRVAFIPNTEGASVGKRNNINRLVWAATQTLSGEKATALTLNWLKDGNMPNDWPPALDNVLTATELHVKMLRVYCQRVLNVAKSKRLVIANGKIFGPLSDDEIFTVDDYALIDRFNAYLYGDKIGKVLKRQQYDKSNNSTTIITSDTLFKLYSCLASRTSKTRFKIPDDVQERFSVVKLPPKQMEQPHFRIDCVIDPASRAAQKLASILILLRKLINCQMRIYLTPVRQHSDMPVKNFYRYVIEDEVNFLPNGKLAEGPLAKFTGLPANSLLTQNFQVPENWLVEAVRSVYDLDNIRLNEIGGPVHSEFELEHLLLEGHCFDSGNGAPPRGLQITLGTNDNPTMVDTIVMANLGYLQLKANPGIWELRLRDGKSADIYDITHAEGPNTVHTKGCTKVLLSSLRSHVIKLRVTKKANMQNADLLDDDDETPPTGIWNSITSSFGGGGSSSDGGSSSSSSGGGGGGGGGSFGINQNNNDREVINIFSVASGHLYERLLRIMMVSLLKHTKSPVKFWFLKNYLSPQFTDFLPHMAVEYNFQYELVQYKWPRWLHQQTEKQRTIWGYKILFLDVLFPLSVRKIIFVDADAIVRSDIKELYDMDLGGAPYAYTPFCDSRKEMEGFRFWKLGYWRNHLMGRRYHISALYVVDLKRFRKIAAGDRLRGQYQPLSQDPNSLSNLDQDLPNNMIHQVTIKSLPDEWLWCETWCNDESFKKAKVIDLCNNPLTKEAKLTAAQRIVPEWKDYDAEIKKLLAKIEDRENNELETRPMHADDDDDDDDDDEEEEEEENAIASDLKQPTHSEAHDEL